MEQIDTEKKRFSKRGRRWTDEEKRYLITHKTDGAYRIAAALGRSVVSVQVMACRLHVSLVQVEGEICPRCGTYRLRVGSYAARHGLCPVCWEREKAEALRERRAFQRAHRDYESAKKS